MTADVIVTPPPQPLTPDEQEQAADQADRERWEDDGGSVLPAGD